MPARVIAYSLPSCTLQYCKSTEQVFDIDCDLLYLMHSVCDISLHWENTMNRRRVWCLWVGLHWCPLTCRRMGSANINYNIIQG